MIIPAQTTGSLLPASKAGSLFPVSDISKERHALYRIAKSILMFCKKGLSEEQTRFPSPQYFFLRQKGKK